MPTVYHRDVPVESFTNGTTYQTLVGNAQGSTPECIGIQVSPPGYATPTHSPPYMEILTILEEPGEAWMAGQEGVIKLTSSMTLSLPAHLRHGFRVIGDQPLTTYGVHVSPERVVHIHEE